MDSAQDDNVRSLVYQLLTDLLWCITLSLYIHTHTQRERAVLTAPSIPELLTHHFYITVSHKPQERVLSFFYLFNYFTKFEWKGSNLPCKLLVRDCIKQSHVIMVTRFQRSKLNFWIFMDIILGYYSKYRILYSWRPIYYQTNKISWY